MLYLVAVHGGAGHHAEELDMQHKKALKSYVFMVVGGIARTERFTSRTRRACRTALNTLSRDPTGAANAVTDGIGVLEDDPCLNAGRNLMGDLSPSPELKSD